jgi:hypothetical protein
MRILTITAITALALPFMALGQTAEPEQTQGQGQTKDTQATVPAKGKKMKAPEESNKAKAKPGTATDVRGQTNVKGRPQQLKKNNEPGERSSTNETNVKSQTNVNQTTTVNKQEFRSRHSEVFSLGRHPKEFFVQRFGDRHFRLIGNSYFAFVDGCWVAVDVDGFVYTERVICPGDPDFIEVVD